MNANFRIRFVFLSDQPSGCQACEGFEVFLGGLADDILREDGTGCGLVPIQRFEVVADELFVKARLRFAGCVSVGGPKTRAVGRERFVNEDKSWFRGETPRQARGDSRDETEFEFRVGDNDAALGGVIAGEAIQGQGNVAYFFGERLANDLGATLKVD